MRMFALILTLAACGGMNTETGTVDRPDGTSAEVELTDVFVDGGYLYSDRRLSFWSGDKCLYGWGLGGDNDWTDCRHTGDTITAADATGMPVAEYYRHLLPPTGDIVRVNVGSEDAATGEGIGYWMAIEAIEDPAIWNEMVWVNDDNSLALCLTKRGSVTGEWVGGNVSRACAGTE